MNINKFTQKSIEAVQNCEKIAVEYGNQEIEQEHLLYALLAHSYCLVIFLKAGASISFAPRFRKLEEMT